MNTVVKVIEEIKLAFPELQFEQDDDVDRTLLYLDKVITIEIDHEDDFVQSITLSMKMYFNAYSEMWSNKDDLSISVIDHKICIAALQYLYNLTAIQPQITDETEHHDVTFGFYNISYAFECTPEKNDDTLSCYYLTSQTLLGESRKSIKDIIQAVLDTSAYCLSHFSKGQYDEKLFVQGYQNFEHTLETFIETEKIYKEHQGMN